MLPLLAWLPLLVWLRLLLRLLPVLRALRWRLLWPPPVRLRAWPLPVLPASLPVLRALPPFALLPLLFPIH